MSRLPLITAETADTEQAALLTEVKRQLGRVPNLYAALANSPATLRGYLSLRDALTGSKLDARTREQLALLVAHENGCDYCIAAHTMRAGRMGFSENEIADTRAARADDPHADAVLRFAHTVLHERGRVDDDLLESVRQRGVTDAELSETVGHVALNILSNYFNHVAEPELDFPTGVTHPTERIRHDPTLAHREPSRTGRRLFADRPRGPSGPHDR
ncbi:carboxymuconolactone decarboxylase family protein [Nocardia sp. NPDC050710]|uniref:carboxymuconolactone decarboxylase family protein n=1 Tax=Nocardia sp. NPDC050710 TaxID=3157220 RepID=UPI0033E0E35C